MEPGPLQAQFPQLTNDPTFFRFFVPSLRTWIGCDLSICKSQWTQRAVSLALKMRTLGR